MTGLVFAAATVPDDSDSSGGGGDSGLSEVITTFGPSSAIFFRFPGSAFVIIGSDRYWRRWFRRRSVPLPVIRWARMRKRNSKRNKKKVDFDFSFVVSQRNFDGNSFVVVSK